MQFCECHIKEMEAALDNGKIIMTWFEDEQE